MMKKNNSGDRQPVYVCTAGSPSLFRTLLDFTGRSKCWLAGGRATQRRTLFDLIASRTELSVRPPPCTATWPQLEGRAEKLIGCLAVRAAVIDVRSSAVWRRSQGRQRRGVLSSAAAVRLPPLELSSDFSYHKVSQRFFALDNYLDTESGAAEGRCGVQLANGARPAGRLVRRVDGAFWSVVLSASISI